MSVLNHTFQGAFWQCLLLTLSHPFPVLLNLVLAKDEEARRNRKTCMRLGNTNVSILDNTQTRVLLDGVKGRRTTDG